MGKELTKAPLSFSMDLDSPHIRADIATDILGLSDCAHNVACRPEFSAIPASAVFCLSPAAMETRVEPSPGRLSLLGFVSSLGDSWVSFLSPHLPSTRLG